MPDQRDNNNRRQGDLQAFFQSLQPYCVNPSQQGPYTFEDRYRDFRKVFFGSEEGKRVLAQIIAASEGLPVTLKQIDSHAYLAFRQGQREIGLRVVQWMNAVPAEPEIETEKEDDR